MGIISLVCKIALGITNSIISTLGLIFTVLGICLLAGVEAFSYLKDTLEDELEDAATETGTTLDTSNLDMTDILFPVGVGLVVIGVLMIAISIVCFVALACNLKYLMLAYALIVTGFFLILFILVLVVYIDDSSFDTTVKPYLKDTMVNYQDIEGNDTDSLIWNAIMYYLDCCGVDDYNDFHHSRMKYWPPTTINGQTLTDQKTPVVCCRVRSTDYSCAEAATATDANNLQNEGCYKKIWEDTTENAWVITIVTFTLLILAGCMFCAYWIVCTHDNFIDII